MAVAVAGSQAVLPLSQAAAELLLSISHEEVEYQHVRIGCQPAQCAAAGGLLERLSTTPCTALDEQFAVAPCGPGLLGERACRIQTLPLST